MISSFNTRNLFEMKNRQRKKSLCGMEKIVHEQETHLCYINREKDKSAAHYCSDISTAISTELVPLNQE